MVRSKVRRIDRTICDRSVQAVGDEPHTPYELQKMTLLDFEETLVVHYYIQTVRAQLLQLHSAGGNQ